MVERRRRSLSSGTKIGKYELRDPIRMQPERALFKAYDPFLDRSVAIKIIQLFDPGFEAKGQATDIFFSEARAIARLQHQNIVAVYDAGMGDYEGYMVMEFVHGQSLLDCLKQNQKLPTDQALRIAIQICHALRYAHAKNIIHRDIKPSNIMLAEDGQIKLVDFGISHIQSPDDTSVNLVGTPSYMAPELVDGKNPTELSDLFSVGVVLYEMVSGNLPFAGKDAHGVLYKIINEEPTSLEQELPSLPVPIRELIYKTLAKDPRDRYQSILELEQALEDSLGLSNQATNFGMDTKALKTINVFADCSAETLQDLALCAHVSEFEAEDIIVEPHVAKGNDYYYLIAGKMHSQAGDKEIITTENQWWVENLTSFRCKALEHTQVLHISGDQLNLCKMSTQAYFYRHLAQYLSYQLQ